MMGQVDIMVEAHKRGKSAIVFEDDATLCSDFEQRFVYLEDFLNKHEWDVAWLGGTVHIPAYWHTGRNPDLLGSNLGKDAEPTDDPRIVKCYGAFSTFAYIVRYESIRKVISLLEQVMSGSMGIDFSFIQIGDRLNTFMYLPGMVRQIDNLSDIGQGMTVFSGFSKIGPWWYQDRAEQFNPNTIQWK
jgi:hypothetical protein